MFRAVTALDWRLCYHVVMRPEGDNPVPKRPRSVRTSARYITDEERSRRYRRAVDLARQGMDTATIAERVELTVRQVEEYLRYRAKRHQ